MTGKRRQVTRIVLVWQHFEMFYIFTFDAYFYHHISILCKTMLLIIHADLISYRYLVFCTFGHVHNNVRHSGAAWHRVDLLYPPWTKPYNEVFLKRKTVNRLPRENLQVYAHYYRLNISNPVLGTTLGTARRRWYVDQTKKLYTDTVCWLNDFASSVPSQNFTRART